MKPIDILDVLSDLPEEYTAFAVRKSDPQQSPTSAQTKSSYEKRIIMKHSANAANPPHRIRKTGIAAALALCIGLNAALILGIAHLKNDHTTLTPGMAPPVEEISTQPIQPNTKYAPNLVAMNWNAAKRKAKDCGILLAKQNVNANDQPAGTVVEQVPYANTELSPSRIVFCNVAIDPNAHDTEITFQLSKKQNGWYYIYLRDEQQEFLGCSMTFYMNDIGMDWGFTVECPEPDTKAEAVLVNAENRKEAVIGTYILHQSPTPYAEEWRTFTPFDVVSEDVEVAFRQVQS